MNENGFYSLDNVLLKVLNDIRNHTCPRVKIQGGGNFRYFWSDTITTSNIFQYFLTAMPDSHSLILDMIQQFEKKF